jgi:hypothetical protein
LSESKSEAQNILYIFGQLFDSSLNINHIAIFKINSRNDGRNHTDGFFNLREDNMSSELKNLIEELHRKLEQVRGCL